MKMWYIYSMEYYSAIRKDKIAFCDNMGGSSEYHAKRNKSDGKE